MVPTFTTRMVDDAEALKFWQSSPHATVFTHPDVLSALSPRHEWWLALKGESPICLWPVPCGEDGKIANPAFSYFVGPMWSAEGACTPAHRMLSYSLGVYNVLIAALVDCYGEVHAELPVGLDDVRSFDWWNYDQPGGPRFRITPRYTAQLTGLQQTGEVELLAGLRPVRRQELRRVEREGAPRRLDGVQADQICRLYVDVMERQHKPMSAGIAGLIEKVCALAEGGHGSIVAYGDRGQDRPASVVLLLIGKKIANMVLGLSDSRYRNSGLQAWTVLNAILDARSRDCDVFDFNGANSPQRGDDKHSYGARSRLYFRIDYESSPQE